MNFNMHLITFIFSNNFINYVYFYDKKCVYFLMYPCVYMNYKLVILMIRKREIFFLNIILQQKDTPMSHDRKIKIKMVDTVN